MTFFTFISVLPFPLPPSPPPLPSSPILPRETMHKLKTRTSHLETQLFLERAAKDRSVAVAMACLAKLHQHGVKDGASTAAKNAQVFCDPSHTRILRSPTNSLTHARTQNVRVCALSLTI